jgi:hypothetical protein
MLHEQTTKQKNGNLPPLLLFFTGYHHMSAARKLPDNETCQ